MLKPKIIWKMYEYFVILSFIYRKLFDIRKLSVNKIPVLARKLPSAISLKQ